MPDIKSCLSFLKLTRNTLCSSTVKQLRCCGCAVTLLHCFYLLCKRSVTARLAAWLSLLWNLWCGKPSTVLSVAPTQESVSLQAEGHPNVQPVASEQMCNKGFSELGAAWPFFCYKAVRSPCIQNLSSSVYIADTYITIKDYIFMRKDLQVFLSLQYGAIWMYFLVLWQKIAGVHLLLEA